MRCASGNPCTWIPDDRLSSSIQFTTTTPQLRRHPWHVKDPSRIIGQVRTRMWRARYGRREPSPPGTGTVAVPSPGNARAIAARKGRSPPCLRGAAGRSSAAINFQVICAIPHSRLPAGPSSQLLRFSSPTLHCCKFSATDARCWYCSSVE
jgi:hypothetical protein